MKKTIAIIILLGAGLSWGQSAPYRFSLEQAVQFALTHNREALNAEKSIRAAQKQKWEVIAQGLPNISVQGNYQHAIEQQKSLIPAQIFGGKEGEFIETAFGTKDNASAQATLSQLIFSGSYIVGIQSAKVYAQISKLSQRKTQQEIRKTVIEAYTNVLLLEESIKILEQNIQTLEKNLRETRKMFENGLEQEESVEQLQITYAQLTHQYEQTKRLLDWGRKALNISLGVDIAQKVTLSETLESLVERYIKESITETPSFDIQNNVDYQIAKNQTQTQKLLLRNEQMKLLPTISAFVNGGYNSFSNNGFTFFNPSQKWLGMATAGVSVDIPLFSSWGKGAAIQRQAIEWEKSKNELWQQKQQIQLQFEKANSDWQFSLQQYQTLKENLLLAQRIERKNQIKFKEGVAGSFDLRQAQLQLYDAQQEYLKAAMNLITQKEELNSIISK